VIDLRRLRSDPEGTRALLARRLDGALDALLDDLLALDARRRQVLARVETLKAERNKASDEVARRKRTQEPADDLMATAAKINLVEAETLITQVSGQPGQPQAR